MTTTKIFMVASLTAALLMACKPSTGADAAVPASSASASADGAAIDVPPTEAPGGAKLDEATVAMVQGSVGIGASVVACKLGTQAQLDQGIERQRAGYVERGMSGADYDRIVKAEIADTTSKFAGATAPQREQACMQMKAFADKLNQMGKDVQNAHPAGQ